MRAPPVLCVSEFSGRPTTEKITLRARMTNSLKRTMIKDPMWWKKRSSLERSLLIVGVCTVLAIVGLAIALAVIAPNEICLTPECIHTASSILENMDESVDPCDNFYRFACGNFLKNTVIPDDKSMVTASSIITDKIKEQLRSSIEEEYKPSDPRHIKLVKTLYKACMNTTAIEEQGLAPLHKRLKDLGGWPVLEGNKWRDDSFNLKELMYKLRKLGESVGHFIDFAVLVDIKNSTNHVIGLDQASLGLSLEILSKGLSNKTVSAYYSYMVDIAVMLGANKEQAAKELKESLEFAIKLANISLPNEKRHNVTALYNPMTVRELMQKYPTIPWMEYLNILLAPTTSVTEDEVVIVTVPSFISELERLLKQVPKRVQANYVMWRVASNSVNLLTDEIRKRQLAYETVVSGNTAQSPRWKECTDAISSLSLSIDALYVRKYFNEESKKVAVELVSDIKEEFIKILKTVDWIDDETRKAALDKAQSMTAYIAYPDELLDDNKIDEFYKKLEISPDNYFQAMDNVSLFFTDYYFGKLRQQVNMSDWKHHTMPAVVNAFYSFVDNSIDLPAGILQGVYFNNNRPRYMNFGGIGYIIGHEITHGFDDHGRQFDKNGNMVDWWEAQTKEEYLKRAECIISQYGNYTDPEVNLKLDGINMQDENIADNGGIKQAYLAYNGWVRRNGAELRLPGLNYNNQQMFWISAANIWCSKYRPEVQKKAITTGFHSPNEFRILGPLSNMPEFARDFNCPVGSPMNPEKKCVVW